MEEESRKQQQLAEETALLKRQNAQLRQRQQLEKEKAELERENAELKRAAQ